MLLRGKTAGSVFRDALDWGKWTVAPVREQEHGSPDL